MDLPELKISAESTTWIATERAPQYETPAGWEDEEGGTLGGAEEWSPAIAVCREPDKTGASAGQHTWWVSFDNRDDGGSYCYAEGSCKSIEQSRAVAHATAVAFRGSMS